MPAYSFNSCELISVINESCLSTDERLVMLSVICPGGDALFACGLFQYEFSYFCDAYIGMQEVKAISVLDWLKEKRLLEYVIVGEGRQSVLQAFVRNSVWSLAPFLNWRVANHALEKVKSLKHKSDVVRAWAGELCVVLSMSKKSQPAMSNAIFKICRELEIEISKDGEGVL